MDTSRSELASGVPAIEDFRIDLHAVARRLLREQAADFGQRAHLHEELAVAAVLRKGELTQRLRLELDAAQKAKHRARPAAHWRLWLAVAMEGVVAAIVVVLAAQLMPKGNLRDLSWLLIPGALLVVGAFLISQYLVGLRADRSTYRTELQKLRAAVDIQVAELLREIIKDRAAQAAIWGSMFDSVYAPTLVGVGVDNAVSSTTYEELSRFIAEHPTSAIGIAGPRGSASRR